MFFTVLYTINYTYYFKYWKWRFWVTGLVVLCFALMHLCLVVFRCFQRFFHRHGRRSWFTHLAIRFYESIYYLLIAILLAYLGSQVTLQFNLPVKQVAIFSSFGDLATKLVSKQLQAIVPYNITVDQLFRQPNATALLKTFNTAYTVSWMRFFSGGSLVCGPEGCHENQPPTQRSL